MMLWQNCTESLTLWVTVQPFLSIKEGVKSSNGYTAIHSVMLCSSRVRQPMNGRINGSFFQRRRHVGIHWWPSCVLFLWCQDMRYCSSVFPIAPRNAWKCVVPNLNGVASLPRRGNLRLLQLPSIVLKCHIFSSINIPNKIIINLYL